MCTPPALAMDQKGAGVDAGIIVVRPKVINFDQTPGVRVCTTWRSSDRGTRPDLKSNLSTGPHPGVLGLAAAWAFVFAARDCQPVFSKLSAPMSKLLIATRRLISETYGIRERWRFHR